MKHTLCLVAVCAIYSGCATSKGNPGTQQQTPGGGGTGAFPTGSGGTGTTPGTTGTPGSLGGNSMMQVPGTGAAGRSTGTAGSGTSTTGTAGTSVMGTGMAGTGAAGTGTAGTGVAGTGTAGATEDPNYKPPCIAKGSQLVLVGDSYINYQENLAPRLDTRAVKDGALMQGDMYRDYAVPGTSLATSPLLIPPQWDMAKADNPDIKFVVMDGGGNDILLWNSQCLTDGAGNENDPTCQKAVTDATAAAKKMMMDMKASGVAEIVYFFYPNVPAGGHDVLGWAFPMAKQQCEGSNDATFRCHMIDMRPVFTDPGDYAVDGIHPSAAGDEKLADAVWKVMKDNCIAQPSSSGCCK